MLQRIGSGVPVVAQGGIQNFQMLLTGLILIDHAHLAGHNAETGVQAGDAVIARAQIFVGQAAHQQLMEIIVGFAEVVDLFLFDIKHMDPERHAELTGVRNEMILDNLETLLQRRHNVKVRMPLLKGINDSEPEIRAVIDFLTPYKDLKNFKGIDLLPYHKLGVNKYTQLGMEYAIDGDPSLSDDDLDRIEGWISGSDFPVTVIRH